MTREGDLYALYSNQIENKWRDRTSYQDNYLFSIGLFSFVEIGGRLTWAPDAGARDLSANVKLSSEPFFKKYPYVPVVALGMQDVSGGASFFKSKYAVISEDLWRLRLSAGYASGPKQMDGPFAAGEFKAHDMLYLLGEYDTKETNVGGRVVLPHFWKIPISFTAIAKTSIDHKPGNFDVAVGLSLPLDFKVRGKEQVKAVAGTGGAATADTVREPAVLPHSAANSNVTIQSPTPEIQNNDASASLLTLRDRLVRAGFQNVRVCDKNGDTVVIEYENSIFNHNELDALGVVFGIAGESIKKDIDSLLIIIKKKNIRMMQIYAPFRAVKSFMDNGRYLNVLKTDMAISSTVHDDAGTTFVSGDDNSSALSMSLVLWPGLSTWVGTDYGAFDYILSLKPDLYVNLWKGGMLNARWDIPLFWSDNLDNGKPYRDSRTPTKMDRLMFFQGIKLLPGLMANLGAGTLTHNLHGTTNELAWQPGSGKHRIRIAQAWGHNANTHKDMESYLASYRFYHSPLDLSLEGTAGKFWEQDRGFSLEMKRYFGDTTFSIYYKNTTIDKDVRQGFPTHWQAVGVQLAFPLTPQKDMKHYYKMQLRGTDEWNYGQETTLASGNSAGANYLPPVPLAVPLIFSGSLHNQYLNRDRLNESYIKAHLEQIRDVWLKCRALPK